jgi:hypothetical protein
MSGAATVAAIKVRREIGHVLFAWIASCSFPRLDGNGPPGGMAASGKGCWFVVALRSDDFMACNGLSGCY